MKIYWEQNLKSFTFQILSCDEIFQRFIVVFEKFNSLLDLPRPWTKKNYDDQLDCIIYIYQGWECITGYKAKNSYEMREIVAMTIQIIKTVLIDFSFLTESEAPPTYEEAMAETTTIEV